jgi:hypothetical protein
MSRPARRRPGGGKAGRLGGLRPEASRRRPARLHGVCLMWIGATTPLFACPICFQVDAGPVTAGVHAALVVLIGVTVAVLTGFGVFAARFVARERGAKCP